MFFPNTNTSISDYVKLSDSSFLIVLSGARQLNTAELSHWVIQCYSTTYTYIEFTGKSSLYNSY